MHEMHEMHEMHSGQHEWQTRRLALDAGLCLVRILDFAFGDGPRVADRSSDHRNFAVYTGTHDDDTRSNREMIRLVMSGDGAP
ncbi:hypothetical protein AKJ09_00175 [Labilithrix luteola]|uniref:Uncharacterized protein n=1 Tax=Labilithrix luteola TaxID=1391654 RepID=A0A0K1PJC9_9BACT|nr:hypothetical protein [Labilithrix luteola]AKU93511.1 hypothetical protein AKJ09_00175 [Labilithrix luteola]